MMRAVSLAAALAAVLAAAPTAAEPSPTEVTPDQAVALFRSRSPRLAAARAAIDVAATDVIGARIYPNPTLGVMSSSTVHGVATSGETQTVVTLDVPLLIGHQRGRRERAAEASTAAIRAGVSADQAAVEREIRSEVIGLQAAQQRVATLVAAVDDVQLVRGIVAGRTTAGAASPYDLERMDLAVATMSAQLDDARTDELSASRTLSRTVGVPDWHPRASGDLSPMTPAPSPPGPSSGGVDPGHPMLVSARADEQAARAGEDRARADAVPVPSLLLQSYATTTPAGIAITGGLSIPLPLFDRNQGAVARARADERRAALELDAREAELGADLDRARTELGARRHALAAFDESAVARLDHLRAMAETAYRSGQGGIVELLDAVDAITVARLHHVDLLHAVVDAELAVRAASTGD